jgi:hypothetical protein
MIRAASLLFFVFISFVCPLRAQVTISIGQFIQSTERDADLVSMTNQLEYLAGKPYKLAPIQKLEFRTRSNQLDPARQDYAIRVNPANPWEVRNSNNYFKAYQLVLSTEKEIAFKNALVERYTLVVEYMFFLAERKLREDRKKLIDTQVAILERQQGSSFFDPKDYLELKVDQTTSMVELEESAFDIDNQGRKIAGKYPGAESPQVSWDNEHIISVKNLERVIDSLLREEIPSTAIAYQEHKINVATQEYKLEKSNIGLGYIQTQYQPYRTDQDREPWNIAVGFTIPIFNPNKGDMAKRKLDVIEAQHDLAEEKSERLKKTTFLYEKIKAQLVRYNEIEKKINDLNSGTLAASLRNFDSGNPIVVVRFNTNIIKLRLLQAKLQQSILNAYVEFLGYTDRLQKRPLINYLSEGLVETAR